MDKESSVMLIAPLLLTYREISKLEVFLEFLLKYLFVYLAALGLSCGIQALEHTGSVVASQA